MNRGSLDSNVLLRLLLNDVPDQHSQAKALIESGGSFIVADAAIIELAFVLGRAYGFDREQQFEIVVGTLSQQMIVADVDHAVAAFELYTGHPKLSFEDCWLVTSAERSGAAPLWTFDKKLANQTSARLVGSG